MLISAENKKYIRQGVIEFDRKMVDFLHRAFLTYTSLGPNLSAENITTLSNLIKEGTALAEILKHSTSTTFNFIKDLDPDLSNLTTFDYTNHPLYKLLTTELGDIHRHISELEITTLAQRELNDIITVQTWTIEAAGQDANALRVARATNVVVLEIYEVALHILKIIVKINEIFSPEQILSLAVESEMAEYIPLIDKYSTLMHLISHPPQTIQEKTELIRSFEQFFVKFDHKQSFVQSNKDSSLSETERNDASNVKLSLTGKTKHATQNEKDTFICDNFIGEDMTNKNDTPGLFTKLYTNTIHVLPTLLYTSLGIAVKTPLPVIGKVHWSIPVGLCTSNIISRVEETNNLVTDPSTRSHHNHEIFANYLVNFGLATGGYAAAWASPQFALPLMAVYAATDIMTSGDHSPIDILKSYIAGGLDHVLGDHF